MTMARNGIQDRCKTCAEFLTKALPMRSTLIEAIDESMADVPQSVWDNIPTDLARNFDHYLYGAPKERLRGHDDVMKELG